MEALKETPKTSATVLFTGAATRQVVRFASTPARSLVSGYADPELKRRQEICAWIVIAAIWIMFAISLYLNN